jgi:hypothetical protein
MDKIPKLIKFPVGLVVKIEEFRRDQYITSFTAAVNELIRRGLESDVKNSK